MQPHSGGKIMMATDVPFWEQDTGASQRIAALAKAISRAGFRLCIYHPDRIDRIGRERLTEDFPEMEVMALPIAAAVRRGIRRRAGKLMGATGLGPASFPASMQRPWTEERRDAFRLLFQSFQPQVLIVEYVHMAYLLEDLRNSLTGVLKVVDTIDVMSRRVAAFAASGMDLPAISRAEEAAVLGRFDLLLAIQDTEAAEFERLCPGKVVLTVGHGSAVDPIPPRDSHPPRALFFAGPAQHNLDALRHLLDALWPRIAEQAPDAELVIAGGICDRLCLPDKLHLHLLGRVGDPREAYTQADICLNPVMAGSGLKIKNVEALCHGMPLVTTPVGAEGMDAGAGTGFLVGTTVEDFVNHAVRLLGDFGARRQLSSQALAFARDHLSAEAAYRPFLDLLRGACYGQPGRGNGEP